MISVIHFFLETHNFSFISRTKKALYLRLLDK
jgi:hypothetical protein